MRRVLVLSVLSMCLAASATVTGGWRAYKSKEGRYSVSLPKDPMLLSMPFETKGVKLKIFAAISETAEKSGYVVMYLDLPRDVIAVSDSDIVLDRMLDSALKNRKATLLSRREISLGKHPGREFSFKEPDGLIGLTRMYLAGSRVYMPMYVFQEGQAVPAELDQFFGSFKLN